MQMRRLLLLLATLLGLTSLALGQNSVEFQKHFDEGIAALTSGRHDEGITAFKKCFELQPENPTCAYNISCGYSLKNELDPAFEWLGKAADLGFANSKANLELAEAKDKDLANMRADPRFAPLIEKMRKRHEETLALAEKEWKIPLVILPEGFEEMEKVGALVVLHDSGRTKQSVAEGAWKKLAAEHGLALVIPSARELAGATIEQGMTWFTNFEEFSRRYWVAEEPLKPALEALAKKKPIDPARTVIVGEGQGALIAFNVAMRAPRKYAAVLTVNGPFLANLTSSYNPNAVGAGLQVRAVVSSEQMWGVRKEEIAGFSSQMRSALRVAKLKGEVVGYTPTEEQPGLLTKILREQLAALLAMDATPKGAPVEAGSGTEKP